MRDGYFVSFASFPFGSRETSGSKFGMIFNPCLKESQCKTVKESFSFLFKSTALSATLPPLLNNDQLTGPCKLGDPALTSSSSSGCDPGCLKIIIVIVFKNYQMDFTICSVRSNKDVQPENATFQLKVPWELTKLFSPGKSGQELLLITSRCSIPSLCNWFIITIK